MRPGWPSPRTIRRQRWNKTRHCPPASRRGRARLRRAVERRRFMCGSRCRSGRAGDRGTGRPGHLAGRAAGTGRFEGRSSLKTWLFSILANRARSPRVRERRAFPRPTRGPWWTRPLRPWWGRASPPSTGSRRRSRGSMRRSSPGCCAGRWTGLPGRQREVVLLRDVEGLTSAEGCSGRSISEANQRALLHRGRGKLRQVLETGWEGRDEHQSAGVFAAISRASRCSDGDGVLEDALSRSERRRLEEHRRGARCGRTTSPRSARRSGWPACSPLTTCRRRCARTRRRLPPLARRRLGRWARPSPGLLVDTLFQADRDRLVASCRSTCAGRSDRQLVRAVAEGHRGTLERPRFRCRGP